MPLFAIYATDKPDTLALRLERYAEHRTYIEEQEDAGCGPSCPARCRPMMARS